uniref:Conotoxin VxVIB n=1 Tax=Conus vexillum TaxID=89431 RepID=O16B_CONVX|nr:RecName: Full=Conotoxin VxVIB; AltName: Full=Conotoxin vx6b; Flags: Precursor [Conus vexillum]AAN71750.1 conotoxin Vx-VIb [Conus vexillum]
MNLACVLIVAVLFLTASQLATAASYARDKQEYPAVRSSDEMQDSEDLTLTKECTDDSQFCDPNDHDCCSGECIDEGGRGVCAIVPEHV